MCSRRRQIAPWPSTNGLIVSFSSLTQKISPLTPSRAAIVARGGRCKTAPNGPEMAEMQCFRPILQRPLRATMAAQDGVIGLVCRVRELIQAMQSFVDDHGAIWRRTARAW